MTPILKRTGLVNRLVGDLTAEELQVVDVGHWFEKGLANGSNSRAQPPPVANASESAGERLPTLTQVLELFSVKNGLVYIELK